MSKLEIPFIQPTHPNDVFVCSIEGCNGAGKTTLLNRYKKDYPDVNSTSKCKITKCFCKSTPLVLRNSISFLVSH